MAKNDIFASLIEASYPRLQAAYFDRFYEEWLSRGLDPEAAEKQATVWSEKAALKGLSASLMRSSAQTEC